jgi:hypothetical protein
VKQAAFFGAAQQISADVEKPIGLTFKESKAKGGGLVVTVSSLDVQLAAATSESRATS